MKKVVLFGFEPFSNFPENPTQKIIETIKLRIENVSVHARVLPVTYEGIDSIIASEIRAIKPDLVIGTGLAAGRSRISVEKIAINYRFSETPDVNGRIKKGEKIDPDMPDGIFATIGVEELVDELNKKGIPAEVSLSAGGYICNEAMFIILREAKKIGARAGFVHFPCDHELPSRYNVKCPSMDMKTMIRALKFIIMEEIRNSS